jgi:NAD(P)-dependent dehydrogenase (short-subunit alcohol dehydrogenase family)
MASPIGSNFVVTYRDIGIQGRLGEPHEIVAVAAFLASDRSPLLNAAAIVADGGGTASLI